MAGNGEMTQQMMNEILIRKLNEIHDRYWPRGIRGFKLLKISLQELENFGTTNYPRYLNMVLHFVDSFLDRYPYPIPGYIAPRDRRGGRRTRGSKRTRSRRNKRLR